MSSTTTVTLKQKAPLVVPTGIQRKARLKAGDRVEFRASPGKITIISKPLHTALTDDDVCTPEQRKTIEAQVAEGLADIAQGRVSRRFETVEQMLSSLKGQPKGALSRKTRSR